MNSSEHKPGTLSESDRELLSAYLDSQLGAAERVGLERRIKADAALHLELEELRETVGVLRTLEPVRPPRSFTLDPATVARRRARSPFAWVMQLGSGLAGLALVLLATVQMLGAGLTTVGAPAAMEAYESPAAQATAEFMEVAPQADSVPQPEAAPAPANTERMPGADTPAEGQTLPPPSATPPVAATAPAAAAASREAPAEDTAASTAADGTGAAASTEAAAGEPPASEALSGSADSAPALRQTEPIQSSESSSPGTVELEEPQITTARPAPGIPPGLTLALGIALVGLAVGWYLYGRRRA